MPREGLSETGQIIAAVATAIILALLAKYGLLPDEDGGKKEGDDNGGGGGNGKTVINIQIGGERLEDVARAGRDAMTPHKGTPPRKDESGMHIVEEPFEDLTVGALPILNRSKPIMPNIWEHIGANPHTMPLVVLLDRVYGTQSQISVYSEGFDGWSRLRVMELGVYESQLHFLVDVPVKWDAKDASGRVRQLMVLCRTDDATKVPDHVTCASYLARARTDASERYFLKANKELNVFGTTKGTKFGAASLSTIDRGVASIYVPAIYIPKGPKEILST